MISREANSLQANMIELQPGVTLSLYQIQRKQHEAPYLTHNSDCVCFSCLLEGANELSADKHNCKSAANDLHIVYMPGKSFRFNCSEKYHSVDLLIRPDALAALTGEHYQYFDQAIADNYYLKTFPASFEVIKAAKTLSYRAKNSDGKNLLTQAAAMEYLGQFLEHVVSAGVTRISKRRQKQLTTAKERLLQDLCKAPTIPELAREVGMSQCDLKKGFREQFGSSIYALFQKERMELGKTLLQNRNVTETARQLGYSNTSHFSAAFRKQFGVLPSQVHK